MEVLEGDLKVPRIAIEERDGVKQNQKRRPSSSARHARRRHHARKGWQECRHCCVVSDIVNTDL